MTRKFRYTPQSEQNQVLIKGYSYVMSADNGDTISLAGIQGSFPKADFAELSRGQFGTIEVPIVDFQKNIVALLQRWVDKEHGRVMGGLFVTLVDDSEACLNEIYSRYGR